MAEILSSPSSYSDEYKCDDSYLPVPDPIIEDPDNPEGDEEYYSYLHSGDEYEDEDEYEDGWGSLPEGEDILDIWEKARKVETNRFKIQSILNKRAFELPPNRFPASCVKQENGESRKLQLKARKYIIN